MTSVAVGAVAAPAGPRAQATSAQVLSTILFSVSAFTGAALLFGVQPMIAKLVLPLFGGSPAVWNTSNLFFQVVLLAGYVLTHLTISRLGVRRQARLQALLVLLPLLVLPIGLPGSGQTPDGLAPALWLLVVLVGAVGAPFLLLSTAGPLLQRWFGATAHPRAQDPYFLFAAGNAGSLLALLAYPAVIEPRYALAEQLRLWSAGYVVFAGLILACALLTGRVRTRQHAAPRAAVVEAAAPSAAQRARWVGLAALASTFMLGTTTHLSTDLTPIPLLWVVPLSLYLLSFIVAFALTKASAAALANTVAKLLPALVVPLVLAVTGTPLPVPVQLGAHLVLFAAVALVAHCRLAADRPGLQSLTNFYLLIAVGGALGGAVNALLAPLLLQRMYEYPAVIALAILLVPRGRARSAFETRYGLLGTVLLTALVVASLPALQVLGRLTAGTAGWGTAWVAVLAAGTFGLVGARRPRPYAAGVALVLLVPLAFSPALLSSRTFFGVQQVLQADGVHLLTHGTTVHGAQDQRPGARGEPRSYYHRDGPVGQVFRTYDQQLDGGRLGVVGLGTGALAAYGRQGQSIVFFEIDQATIEIARDPKFFSYLADSRAEVDTVLGDGRLSLMEQGPGQFDLLVLDAFSSDAIPVHLLTEQAVDLYLSRLRPGGLLLFHVTNRYLDLGPVLSDIAAKGGLYGRQRTDTAEDVAPGRYPSSWVVLTERTGTLKALARDPRWTDLASARTGGPAWTDDYSNVLGAFRLRG